jgi:hypothetical protein
MLHTQHKYKFKCTYFLHQFTWHLYSILPILAPITMTWFMQWDRKQVVIDQITLCTVMFTPMLHVHTAHTMHTTEKCYCEQ